MTWLDESLSQVSYVNLQSEIFLICLFQINPHIKLDQFSHTVSFHDNFVTTGYDLDYPLIIMKITLKRNIGYHVLQTFIPSLLFVILGKL